MTSQRNSLVGHMLPPVAPVATAERPSAIFEAIPDMVLALVRSGPPAYVADLEGGLLYANPRYRALAADLQGRFVPEGKLPGPLFDVSETIARLIAGESEVNLREVMETGGVIRVFHSRHFPIRGEDGTLAAVGGIYEDATTETSDWRDMLIAKERYNDISRLTSDLIWETDANFSITYVSPRVTEVLGFHPRQIIGRSLFALGSFDLPGDRLTPEMRSPFRNFAVSVKQRSGRVTQLRLSGLPMFSETGGAFCGYRGTATDVSAEAEARESANVSRERLTTAIENISEGFALYDAESRLVLCNNRFREYLSSAQRVLFPGAPLQGILMALEENRAVRAPTDATEAWRGLRGRAESMGEATIELSLEDGRWLRVTDRPTEDGGIVSIVSDITESKEREETLLSAKELAEQGSRSKSEFLANMSHELRTPLNAIIGFSEIMRAETLGPIGSPRYIGYLDDIIDSSQHLLGVINDILDVAKSEAGKLELNEESVNIAEEARLTARLFAEQAAEADVRLDVVLPGDLPALWADQRKIRQILLNLVSNAVKFTPPGGAVTVSARIDDHGGMILAVTDTGIGIRKEDLPAALAPFGQVESSLSRRYEGTGLGLPLTQALVERHGGRLVLDSEPGRGTRVAAHFPVGRVRP